MEASRLYRAQSLSTVATTAGRASSVDPLAGISKIRDDDFRKSILEKVNRAKRSLSVRPDVEESTRSSRSRHYSVSETPSSSSVSYLPINTARSTGLVLPSGGSVEFWPTTVTDPGRSAVRYGSVQPEALRRRVDVDTLTLPAAVTISRKRVLDEADDAVIRGSRMSDLLQQLRRIDGAQNRYEQAIEQYAPSSRSVSRAEVDLVARTLGRLSLPSLRGSSISDLRRSRHAGDVDATNGDDFLVRLASSRGDLQRLEGLASKTFSWNDHPGKWEKQFTSALTVTKDEPSTGVTGAKVVEVNMNHSPKEIFTFFNDRSVGIKQTDTAADQAIRWAQQRRLTLESDLQKERMKETYGIHDIPTAVSVLGLVRRPYGMPARSRYQREPEEDDYVTDDTVFTPRYVPTVVRPWSATSRGRDRGTAAADDLDVLTRQPHAYARSSSNAELGRHADDAYNRQPHRYEAPKFEVQQKPQQKSNRFASKPEPVKQAKPEMSEARRRVREVLAKSKGDPHYFDRRPQEDDDY